jgi:xylulokinase
VSPKAALTSAPVPLVMGIDSSTQSTKVEVRDVDTGALVSEGHAVHPVTTPPRSEQHPSAWIEALEAASAQAGPRAREVAAVAVAAQQHGMVVLDDDGEVIRPAKLWNDTESAADARWLIEQLGGEAEWARACGSVPVAAFTITKLSWLHRSEPDAWSRVARVFLPHDWLTWRLTGEFVTDRSDASGTGYFSARANTYRLDLLAIVDQHADWAPRLPRVCGPFEAVGSTTKLGAEPVVAPGTGDNMAAALGVALGPGDVAISIGTSGTIFAVSDTSTADPSGVVAGFADASGKFLPLVCTLNATKVTDAVARLLGVDHGRLEVLASDASRGSGGVVVVPYFDGERTPNRPDASGRIEGVRSDVTREQIARAAFEGVVCGLLEGLDGLISAGVRTDGRCVLVGGGARSTAYRQILADLAGRTVSVPEAAEHVAVGACVQAAAVLEGRTGAEVAKAWHLDAGRDVEPDPTVDRDAIRARYASARG